VQPDGDAGRSQESVWAGRVIVEAYVSKLNASWHAAHRLPEKATLDERVRSHQAHAAACGCREMPKTVLAALEKRGRPAVRRSVKRAP
jgi:NAD(P)H-flavin reductase